MPIDSNIVQMAAAVDKAYQSAEGRKIFRALPNGDYRVLITEFDAKTVKGPEHRVHAPEEITFFQVTFHYQVILHDEDPIPEGFESDVSTRDGTRIINYQPYPFRVPANPAEWNWHGDGKKKNATADQQERELGSLKNIINPILGIPVDDKTMPFGAALAKTAETIDNNQVLCLLNVYSTDSRVGDKVYTNTSHRIVEVYAS